jgi:outer membrane protein assembly factor BamB
MEQRMVQIEQEGKKKKTQARWKEALLFFLAALVVFAGLVVLINRIQPPQPPQGREQWVWRMGSLGGSPAVSNGMVYISTQENKVFALDAASGRVRWSTQLGKNNKAQNTIIPSPVVDSGMVYANAQDGLLYALDARTGNIAWTYQALALAGPAVANGVVYIGAKDGVLSALDAASGRERWSFQIKGGVTASPVAANGLLYVIGAGNLYALDAASGREQWTWGVSEAYAPAVANGIVYLTTTPGDLYALDASTGQVQWKSRRRYSEGFSGSPVIAGNIIYVNSAAGVFALSSADGSERWLYGVPMPGAPTAPAVIDGTVYVGSGDPPTVNGGALSTQPDEKLYALDAATGKVQWFYQLGGAADSTPLVSNGVIYIGANDGTLYAVMPPG